MPRPRSGVGGLDVPIKLKKIGNHILIAAAWYLGGCCVGALVAPQYILHAILEAPLGVFLHFLYPDILMGSFGIFIVGVTFMITGSVTVVGATTAGWRLCRAGIYATVMTIGLFGGFAAALAHVI